MVGHRRPLPARTLALASVLAAVVVAVVLGGGAAPGAAAPAEGAPPPATATTVLVELAGQPGSARAAAAMARHGLRPVGDPLVGGWVEAEAGGRSAEALERALRDDGDFLGVAPNHVRRAASTPSDPLFAQQTELSFARFPEAWDLLEGSAQVSVAVLDSGVDLDHPDLAPQLDPGVDFVADDLVPQDQFGHGTMVAGIVGAAADASGVVGGAHGVRLLPVRVLDADGNGDDADIIAGIRWAADAGAGVLTMSFGGPGASGAIDDAVAYARGKGAVVVGSSGNHGRSEPWYPAASPGVLSVGAVDTAGRVTYFSGHGSTVDLVAVGVSVLSTELTPGPNAGYSADGDGDGTSFSAPQVAAAAALLRSGGMTGVDVENRLVATARDAGPAGRDHSYGHGILDVGAAAGATPGAPLAPAAGDAREPDGTAARATILSPGALATATISPEQDVDWFAVDVGAPGRLTARVTPPKLPASSYLGMDPIVELRTGAGKLLRRADDAGLDDPEAVSAALPAAGRYLLVVTNAAGSRSGGDYSLATSFEPEPPAPPPPPAPARSGYWMVDASGVVHPFGDAESYGNAPVGDVDAVDVEPTASGNGYWVLDAAGRVFSFGDATYRGALGGLAAWERATSLSATPSGDGYWIFTSFGRVVAFGDAPHVGDMSGRHLNGPVLDSIPTASGGGYYMVASDGGIFTFGDAAFLGSMGATPLNAPVQSLVPDSDGRGYWLVASDGGIFSFDAPFYGSMGSVRLNRPVTGMVGAEDGYLMVAEDGGIFTFGGATFHGSLGANPPARPVTSVATLAG